MADYKFEGKLIRVKVEKGKEMVEHPDSVAVVALDERSRAILTVQPRPAADGRLLELPAGLLDKPGESPEAAARRELEEETGLRAASCEKLGEWFSSPGFTDEKIHLFLATGLSGEAREGEWLPLAEAAARTRDLKTVAGLLLAARRLASG